MSDAFKEIKMSDCENLIKQIRDVISVKIVVSGSNEIEEIHVLAEDTRNAKQIVRDIETLLRIEYGIELDHKKISIVQLNKEKNGFMKSSGSRLQFSSIQYAQNGSRVEATVELSSAQKTSQGKSSGINSNLNRLRIFAEATLNAVGDFLEQDCSVLLEDVCQSSLANRNYVCIALTHIQGYKEDFLLGSALIRTDEREAVVRATLDALNRRVVLDSN